jgi:hypothetical protein
MGRGRGFLIAVAVAALGWSAYPGSAQADGLGGDWVVTGGKFAGTSMNSDANGRVGKHAEKGEPKGHLRQPNDHCGFIHFDGLLESKLVRETDCARVVPRDFVPTFLFKMSFAIEQELDANGKGRVANAIENLGDAFDEMQKAAAANTITPAVAQRLHKLFLEIHKLDEKAKDVIKEDKQKAENLLEDAVDLKRRIVRMVPDELKVPQPPHVEPIDADFQPGASQTVYTEKATSDHGLTYRWGLTELNDPTCVNFEAGKPALNQAIWHHADTQGCNHALEGSNGHQGVIGVTVSGGGFTCTAAYFGSNSGTGGPPTCRAEIPL